MITSKASLMNRLPPEILVLIFSLLRWDGSVPFIPAAKDCPWFQYVRTLKALLLVSQSWYNIAAPMLHSFVYLHRIDQLVRLVRTFGKCPWPRARTSRWVEHVRCEVFVPLHWENTYRDSIVRLIIHCRSIRTLVHAPVFDDRIDRPLDLALLRFSDLFPSFLELKIGEHVLSWSPLPHVPLARFTRLKKLHLDVDSRVLDPAAQNPATLPNLETLICDVSSENVYNTVGAIQAQWEFPKLRNLTVRICWNSSVSVSLAPIKTLCAAYGAHLSSLHIYTLWTPLKENLSGIYTLCPNLHHISYSYDLMPLLKSDTGTSALSGTTHVSSSLRCVSFPPIYFRYGISKANLQEHLSELTQRSLFPNLDTIIILDSQLYGDVVDGSALPCKYAEILHDWSARLRELGIQFLNGERRPLSIILSPECLEDDDDDDYQADSNDSSSVSDDTESDDSDEGSVTDSLMEEINDRRSQVLHA